MAERKRVSPISAETAAAIKRKSAYNLPDRPTERGMKPDEIKRAFYGPITDANNSVISELSRVIDEVNEVVAGVEERFTEAIISTLNTEV